MNPNRTIPMIISEEVANEELKKQLFHIYDVVSAEFANKPSSTKFHHVEKGGMGRHVREVLEVALDVYSLRPRWYQCTKDDVVVVGFVHDFNKLLKYKELAATDWRRQPKYGGKQFEYDYSKVSMSEAAETAIICARNGLLLTDLQLNAISYHHAAFGNPNLDIGFMTPLATLLHFADVMSVKAFDRAGGGGE